MWDYGGSRSLGRLQKKWIDTMKDCLKKRFGCQASKENGSRGACMVGVF